MAVNRTKVLEAAQKFQTKGQYDKAIAEYQKLVVEDPRDVRTLLKIGDLHTRRNKPKDAIEVYDKVADLYAKQGFFLKAVAVYKQILKLDAGHLSSMLKLAQMYEELALASDALTTYELVADAYVAQGQTAKALDTMQRMIALDETNIAARIKYAEALSKAEKQSEAAAAFAEGARLLREQGRIDDYMRVVERQLYHDPDNVEIARELSNRYLERNDPKRALAKLQVCFKADPRDVQTLEMLAEAFRQLGQIPKTISVLKEIARLHGDVNAEEPRRRTLLRVLDLDPTDAEAKQALATTAGGKAAAPKPQPNLPEARPTQAPAARRREPPPPAEPEPEPEPEIEPELEPEELSLQDAEDDDDLLMVAEDSIAEPAPQLVGDLTSPSYPSISGLLTAAEGFESNGEVAKAEEALKTIVLLDEANIEAHERLKELYLGSDRRVDAVRELLWLSEAWDSRDLEQARSYARTAFDLAPRAEATRNRLDALGLDPDTGELAGHTEEVVFVEDSSESPLETTRSPSARPNRALDDEPSLAYARPVATNAERPSVRAPSGESVNPLDIPIEPEEFERVARAPRVVRRPSAELREMASLLDRPLLPEEFDDQHADRDDHHQTVGQTPAPSLLDEPISPDEFDAPPARRAPLQVIHDLDEPIDDFGLSDDSFDKSDLHEVDGLPRGKAPNAAGAETPSENLNLVDEISYMDVGSREVDLAGTGPLQAYRPAVEPIDELAADFEPNDARFTATEQADRELFTPVPTQLPGDHAVAPFSEPPAAEDDELPLDGPEPTVPAEPIPELIRRSSQANLEAIAEPRGHATMRAPEAVAQAPSQPSEPTQETLPAEIEEVLDEAGFFASQSLLDEALEVLQEAMLIYPGSAALAQRVAEYEAALEQKSAEATKKEELSLDESFDIAEQLASELAEVPAPPAQDDMVDVESVFAQFKRGVAAQIAEDDTDTHFDLGIAYKEMGLLDDAINEFEVSSKSPKRAATALTMVGMCHIEKGDPLKAVSFFERALQQSVKGGPEELALNYEIGSAYELSGHTDKAVSAFEKVAARDRTFRGVAGRLDLLKRGVAGKSAPRATR